MTVNKNSIDMLPDENSTQSRVFIAKQAILWNLSKLQCSP